MNTIIGGTSYTIFAVEGVDASGQQYFLGTNTSSNDQGLHFGYRSTADFTSDQLGRRPDWSPTSFTNTPGTEVAQALGQPGRHCWGGPDHLLRGHCGSEQHRAANSPYRRQQRHRRCGIQL